MSIAFTFPGQGSQAAGMGKALSLAFPQAKAVFDEVDAALAENLSAVIFEGPQETLTLTQNAQPALMAVSLAVMRVLEAKGLDLARYVKLVAGHSLGEYSALAAAGAFTVGDAARLLRLRGMAMQAAVPVGKGAMAALLGVGVDAARIIAAEAAQGDVCDVANDNDPGQVVISGARPAIERSLEIAKKHGARRAVLLEVSAPFHCRMMEPAAEAMAEALARAEIRAPKVPVVANVRAVPITEPDEIRRCLVEQVTGTVRWRECVAHMAEEGVSEVYEVGAGRVLTGLARRIVPALAAKPIGTPEEIEAAIAAIKG